MKFIELYIAIIGAGCMAAAACTYDNPVLKGDHPDPGVAFDPKTAKYWAAVTGRDQDRAFALWSSADLISWAAAGFVFPSGYLPKWSTTNYWAPELHFVNGTWTVYFASNSIKTGKLSIGCAKSKGGIAGPYVDIGAPIFGESDMGNIDPSFIEDAKGKPYLLWKRDGNAVGLPTPIFAAPLNGEGTKVIGTATELITNTLPWEADVTEAPWMIRSNGSYYLFYSGNVYSGPTYAIGVAKSDSVTGPFQKFGPPIAHTDSSQQFYGPGHCSVVWTGRDWAMIYAAWNKQVPGRGLMLDALEWHADGYPSLPGDIPSTGPKPIPLLHA